MCYFGSFNELLKASKMNSFLWFLVQCNGLLQWDAKGMQNKTVRVNAFLTNMTGGDETLGYIARIQGVFGKSPDS